MCGDRRDVLDALDYIEDAELDQSETSSDEFSNATKYVPTSAALPIRVLVKSQKRAAEGL